MSELNSAWTSAKQIEDRFGVSAEHGSEDPDVIVAVQDEYLRLIQESTALGQSGVVDLPHASDLKGGEEIISFPLGYHRKKSTYTGKESEFAGKERIFSVYPGRIPMAEEDAETAIYWALEAAKHHPQEENYANHHIGLSGLVVRVEWGSDPTKPYEVEDVPDGYGLMSHFSPDIRSSIQDHAITMGNTLFAPLTEEELTNHSLQGWGIVPTLTSELSDNPSDNASIIVPVTKPDGLPASWIYRSIFPVEHMNDKAHLVDMGLFERIAVDDDEAFARLAEEIESGKPKIMRGLVGACAAGLSIFWGSGEQRLKVNGKDMRGTMTASKFHEAIKAHRGKGEDVVVRDYAPPFTLDQLDLPFSAADRQRFGDPQILCAIKRYFVGFDHIGQPHVLGGMITARPRTTLVHGANDAVNVIVDPPQRRE
jgi:hypothetical protein